VRWAACWRMRRSTFGAALRSSCSVGARVRAGRIIPARSPHPAGRIGGTEGQHGVGEIRTHEGLSPLAVFKTAAFNRSATTPGGYNVFPHNGLFKGHVKRSEAAGPPTWTNSWMPSPNSRQRHTGPDQFRPTLLLQPSISAHAPRHQGSVRREVPIGRVAHVAHGDRWCGVAQELLKTSQWDESRLVSMPLDRNRLMLSGRIQVGRRTPHQQQPGLTVQGDADDGSR
jgi:hypothetical protein